MSVLFMSIHDYYTVAYIANRRLVKRLKAYVRSSVYKDHH